MFKNLNEHDDNDLKNRSMKKGQTLFTKKNKMKQRWKSQ